MKGVMLILMLGLLCGCGSAARREAGVAPAQVSVRMARVAAGHAAGNALRARLALKAADEAVQELRGALPVEAQGRQVVKVRSAIAEATEAVDATMRELEATTGSLADSASRMEALQAQVAAMGTELEAARKAERKEREGRDFWRGVTWKLAVLALGLAVWVLRRPLLALACGL
jgi:hypothetical protein